ncbi:MAG: glycosyltransferase family 2 protein [FCB group bacterium]|jgi:glycosyltransferase involved in cell wall biosynthesis
MIINNNLNKRLPLSVAIITHNEEDNIGRTLESIAGLASQIIIIDSNSLDRTIEIAKGFNAEVFIEDWKGFVEQKNSALNKCNQEWILCLDADEVVSEELKESIIKAIQNPIADGYLINRKTVYLGKLLKHAWQPDWNLRLVKKDCNPHWVGGLVHEHLEIDGKMEKISGCLYHYSYKNLKHHFLKTIDYARVSAESYHKDGRKFSVFNLLFNPVIAWLRLYIINLGFLDGVRGFIAAISSCVYTFLKYAFLYEIDKKEK